jgi:hypothetical protein
VAETIVKSLRIAPTLWARVEEYAASRRWSPNLAATALIEAGLAPLKASELAKKQVEVAPAPPFKSRLKGQWKAP